MQIPESIKPGVYFKYKELCSLLGEPILKSTSREAQLKRWQYEFSFERVSAWIRITEFKPPTKPQTKQWSPMIDDLIGHYILDAARGYGINEPSSELKSLVLYTSEAFIHLGLCNHNHHQLQEGVLDCSASAEEQQEYYEKSFSRLYTIYMRAIDRLASRKIITWTREYLKLDPVELLPPEKTQLIETLKAPLIEKYLKKIAESRKSKPLSERPAKKRLPPEFEIIRAGFRKPFYAELKNAIKAHPELGYDAVYPVRKLWFTDTSLAVACEWLTSRSLRLRNKDMLNQKSYDMHLRIFNEEPFTEITNLVIMQGDRVAALGSDPSPDLHL
jgi:hypothetical protein